MKIKYQYKIDLLEQIKHSLSFSSSIEFDDPEEWITTFSHAKRYGQILLDIRNKLVNYIIDDKSKEGIFVVYDTFLIYDDCSGKQVEYIFSNIGNFLEYYKKVK